MMQIQMQLFEKHAPDQTFIYFKRAIQALLHILILKTMSDQLDCTRSAFLPQHQYLASD